MYITCPHSPHPYHGIYQRIENISAGRFSRIKTKNNNKKTKKKTTTERNNEYKNAYKVGAIASNNKTIIYFWYEMVN